MNAADETKTCRIFEESVSRGGKNTKSFNKSNLHKHLMTKYLEYYTGLQQAEKEQIQAKGKVLVSKKQSTIPPKLHQYQYGYWFNDCIHVSESEVSSIVLVLVWVLD